MHGYRTVLPLLPRHARNIDILGANLTRFQRELSARLLPRPEMPPCVIAALQDAVAI